MEGPRRLAGAFAFVLGTLASVTTGGCKVSENDIHRWETTDRGPRKLCAVLVHDKYDLNLRVEATLSLIRMKPRAGRRPAFSQMDPEGEVEACRKTFVDALASVPPETRQAIVGALLPQIIAELKKPPPVAQAGQPSPPDPSFPYKDAAYAMLIADRATVIQDEALKENLKQALIEWAMADFEHRLDNRTQLFGMEQLLRYIGAPAVAGLPKLMTKDSRRLEQMSSLIAEIGDAKTKESASAALVGIAKFIASDDWLKQKTPELEDVNLKAKLEPTPEQFQMQLLTYQGEELMRAFGSLRKVGGRPAVEFCLTYAADPGPKLGDRPPGPDPKAEKPAQIKAQSIQLLWDTRKEQIEKRRQASLAALEGRLDRNNPDDIKRILQIATSDAPDGILDLAFRRVGEMPRDLVVTKLYEIFKTDKWKIRRAAAATVLKMSTVKNVDEFMGMVPDTKGFAMPEAITYGALIGELKEGDPKEALKKHMSAGNGAVRASALSYYLTFGTKQNASELTPYESDSTSVPVCETDADCKWACEVAKEGSKDREVKDIKTVGEFVKYCIQPTIAERVPEPKKDEAPKKDEPKKDEPKKDEPKKDEAPKKDEPKQDEAPKKDEKK